MHVVSVTLLVRLLTCDCNVFARIFGVEVNGVFPQLVSVVLKPRFNLRNMGNKKIVVNKLKMYIANFIDKRLRKLFKLLVFCELVHIFC